MTIPKKGPGVEGKKIYIQREFSNHFNNHQDDWYIQYICQCIHALYNILIGRVIWKKFNILIKYIS